MVVNLPIIMFILKAYILLFLVNVSLETTSQESSAERSTLLDQLVQYMKEPHTTETSEQFDLCAPGVDRGLICKAINVMYFGSSAENVENDPCAKLLTSKAYFPCKMMDANVRRLKTAKGNKIALELNEHSLTYYPIPTPASGIQLTVPNYAEYEKLAQSFKSEGKSAEEIKSILKGSSLLLVYKVALQITVEQFTEVQEVSEGFDVCNKKVNKGLLCNSINISLHKHSFPVFNDDCKGNNKYFDCKMATGEKLRMKAGHSENTVMLEDDQNVAKFRVDVSGVSEFLQIQYILDGIPKVGLPLRTAPPKPSTST